MTGQGFSSQIKELLSHLSTAHRVVLGCIAILAFGVPLLVVWFFSADRYRVLVSGLHVKTDVATLKSELEKQGIPYRLSDGGKTISVPERHLADFRRHMATEKLMPKKHDMDFREMMEKQSSIGLFPELQRMQRLRALEAEVAKTITMYESVEYARVHITQPRESFFKGEGSPATASVFVEVTPGTRLTQVQVAAIKSLVSHAVEGLSPLNITLCDSAGLDYSSPSATSTGVASGPISMSSARELELTRLTEAVFEGKVNAHVRRLLGPDSFAVAVTVELDLTHRPVEVGPAARGDPAATLAGVVVHGHAGRPGQPPCSSIPGRSPRGTWNRL
ncbi:MAG: flagellar M-ring protein FliF [Candidatus Riflebacteria bacterium]|nr:flagellar M-ring protein FliF [Candidatus Riflebacteria bacterium]